MPENEKLEIKAVPFMGAELMAAKDADGQVWAGVRWMCNGIGLSQGQANREISKISSDEVLKEGYIKFGMGVFDPNNPTVALKLDFVPLWLAKISITPTMKTEHPELAEALKQYQLKAKDVLAAAFLPQQTYSKELQAIFMLDSRTVEHDRRITALEENMVIDYGQQRTLAAQVNAVVITALGGADSPAYSSRSLRGRVYSACNRDLQTWFRVNSRNNIPRRRFDEAVEYIQRWRPSTNVSMLIQQTNRQTRMFH